LNTRQLADIRDGNHRRRFVAKSGASWAAASSRQRHYLLRAPVIAPADSFFTKPGEAMVARFSSTAFIGVAQSHACLSGCPPDGAVEMPNGMYKAQNLTTPVSNASKPTTPSVTPSVVLPVSRISPPRKKTPPNATRTTLSTPPTL
jgi:hypothetical protein